MKKGKVKEEKICGKKDTVARIGKNTRIGKGKDG
jgi:hypothetical protein